MPLHTLGYRTDFFFHRASAVVLEREEYCIVRTPENPSYHWGNFLLFRDAPKAGDLPRWLAAFRKEIGPPDEVGHLVFGWDSEDQGETKPFLAAGMRLESSLVMTAATLTPLERATAATLRRLESDADFAAAVELQVLLGIADGYPEAEHRTFRERKMAGYRRMSDAGQGAWFGAFVDGRLVCDLGLFWEEGVARYQSVGTHPDYRRRGLAGALVHFAGVQALAAGVKQLVIVADEHYFARDLYARLGFAVTERQWGLAWHRGMGRLEQ